MNYDSERPNNKVPYPYNLVEWLSEKFEGEYEFSSASVQRMVETLTDRERRVVLARWTAPKTYEQLGKEFGLTRERIRQIEAKALHKLVHPSRVLAFSCVSRKELTALLKEKEALAERLERAEKRIDALIDKVEPQSKADDSMPLVDPVENMKIDELDLSVRSFNCLARLGYKTIGEVIRTPEQAFYHIRNFGRKSAEEVITKIHAMGLKMKWEREGE